MRKLRNYTLPEILIGINILMFLLTKVMDLTGGDGLIRLGAKVNFLIAFGEYWRLFTAMFLHADVMHLLFNMLALYIFGRDIEHIFGRKNFTFIYLLSGLAGSSMSYLLSNSISVGASGAIFGLMGANLFLYRTNPAVYKRIYGMDYIILIGINLLMGFIRPNIDVAGHLGGLAGGFFVSSALMRVPGYIPIKRNRLFILATTLIILLPIFAGTLKYKSNPETYVTGAYYYYVKNNESKFKSIAEEGIKKYPGNRTLETMIGRSRIY